jgi:Cd2+/Zn2+-exporting ATPase
MLRGAGKTVVLIGDRTGVRGLIAIADVVRPRALPVIQELKRLGISRTVMLTGDNRLVGEAISAPLGIDEVRADLLPEEKLLAIRSLMRDGRVAMVGDGVNDAPALATATVGFTVGAAGSDAALMADNLDAIPYGIQLSRMSRRIVRQNLTFSIGVIVVLVSLALTVGIPLPLGVVGDEGSTVLVVLNGPRLLRPLAAPHERREPWRGGMARLRAVLLGRRRDAPPATNA